MLRYTCAKELCMISRSAKSSVIRKFYIDLEKLLITYKDSIVKDLNNQLGINVSNKEIIKQYKNKGLVYVLKVDDTNLNYATDESIDVKIGSTIDLEDRIKQYNVGRVNELPIVLVYLSDDADELEKCLTDSLRQYRIKKNLNSETFKIDLDFIKETIKYCTIRKSLLLKQNKKLLNQKDDRKFVIIVDKENLSNIDLLTEPSKKLGRKKPLAKKSSKSSIKNSSKKSTKSTKSTKSSKTTTKKLTKKATTKKTKTTNNNI